MSSIDRRSRKEGILRQLRGTYYGSRPVEELSIDELRKAIGHLKEDMRSINLNTTTQAVSLMQELLSEMEVSEDYYLIKLNCKQEITEEELHNMPSYALQNYFNHISDTMFNCLKAEADRIGGVIISDKPEFITRANAVNLKREVVCSVMIKIHKDKKWILNQGKTIAHSITGYIYSYENITETKHQTDTMNKLMECSIKYSKLGEE
jgi:hypothetical protein